MTPTLALELDNHFYTHGKPLHVKKLMDIVKRWEDAYQARIEELENQARVSQSSRMIDEGGPTRSGYIIDDDNKGNRYGSD